MVVSLGLLPATAFLSSSSESISPETVEIAPRIFTYRIAGDFHLAGRPVDAPAVTIARNYALRIMRRQVAASEYARCVSAGQCRETSSESASAEQFPAVNVSWEDATAYAAWLSKKTGYSWRLPTDEEWVFAAGSRFHDDALSVGASFDPSVRWLARYEREAESNLSNRVPRRIGAFGTNEYGLLDLSGNVWEWTNTCFFRQSLDERGATVGASIANCGVRVAEGEHRAYVPNFIRDASKGGCAAGKPPSNLGFRLIRDDAGYAFIRRLKRLLFSVGCLSVRSEACRTGLFPS